MECWLDKKTLLQLLHDLRDMQVTTFAMYQKFEKLRMLPAVFLEVPYWRTFGQGLQRENTECHC